MTSAGVRASVSGGRRVALMRPPVRVRILAVSGGVLLAALTVALGAETSGWVVAFIVFECVFIGLLFNAARHQGAWLVDDQLVLETALGRSAVPLASVRAVHVDDPLTTMGVDVGAEYMVMSVGSPAGPREPAGSVEGAAALLADRNIPVVRHASHAAVTAVRRPTAPWHSIRAVVDTVRRPLVVGTAIAGTIYAILEFSRAA